MMLNSNRADRAVATVLGVISWISAAGLLASRFSEVLRSGSTIHKVGLLWLCIFLIPVGWAVQWFVRSRLAKFHGYTYRPRMIGSGLFRWLD